MPSLDFLKSTPQTEALAIESEPPGAEAKASTGESCRTPCQLTVQPGGELSVTLALNGYQPQTVSVREADGVQLQPGAAPSARKPAAKKKKPVTAAVRPPPSATASAATPPTSAPAVAPAPAPSAEPAASATNYPWPSR
jgi:hypothetical protein